MTDDKSGQKFVEDYFELEHSQFIKTYFANNKHLLSQKMTQAKYQQLFGELSQPQFDTIKDNESQYITVLAGPGSGKTRVLVHKLASLLLMENVKHEQLLMLTFSRAAAYEFKARLYDLIGNAAAMVEIKTFHAYCFDLLGRVGSIEQLSDNKENVILSAIDKINHGDVEINRIAKTVLVLDEAQDINKHQFELIKTLIKHNEGMRVIAVGDDDQTIYEYNGASPIYMNELIHHYGAKKYNLLDNYRSKANVIRFSNHFAKNIQNRLKDDDIIAINQDNGTVQYIHTNTVIDVTLQMIHRHKKSGTIGVLTRHNDEAKMIFGALKEQGLNARLVQSMGGFGARKLIKIKEFDDILTRHKNSHIISNDLWDNAVCFIKEKYAASKNLHLFLAMVESFEKANATNKYHSDFDMFLQDCNLEDFYQIQKQIIRPTAK